MTVQATVRNNAYVRWCYSVQLFSLGTMLIPRRLLFLLLLPHSIAKASLFGATITIPVTEGRFNLGTWQGIYLCEFRAAKHSRRVVATILS